MATSALSVSTAKIKTHDQSFHAIAASNRPRCFCSSKAKNNGNVAKLSWASNFGLGFGTKKWALDVGIGLLAASVVAISPLDAEATRIEYYATVGEPSCDLNFARSGLGFCDVQPGSGAEAPYGELINVHYTARFADGRVFDSSYKRGRPLTMRIGVGKILRGLDQGILGGEGVPPMSVGGKRKLLIPPELAYGPEPAGCFSGDCNIPGNATLVYDINFVGIYSGNRK
ncbi:Peptidyl-prolyl cis-trans isomerase, FKBP-type [Trema orientale]|uniref:peptidylprolyl isomerase n=1 Tax=Trema orientale TaxID=63057 RepID=A0A2P5DH00_TREOI|nr:Peptidyl-prolyl cis-trans isomerase, FKBP-type [Trema orientale]